MLKVSHVQFTGPAAFVFLAATFVFGGSVAQESDDLYRGFQDPPMQARPFVRWWWNGNKLSRQEIIRELDVLKEAGIGGVEINPIKFPNPEDPLEIPSLEWLSHEWIAMFKAACEAAARRGMTADCIVGSGWPFGGPFLEGQERTQIMSLGTRVYNGPREVSLTEKEILDEVELTLHSKHEPARKQISYLRLMPASMDAFTPGVEISPELKNGKITFNVPAGEHVLHMLVLQEGFQAVINGAPGADGPVLNHYNAAAVRKYLEHMSSALKPQFGSLGDHLRAMFCDSLELEGANWCEDMPEQFEQRRGYSILPYLPLVLTKTGHMGNIVEQESNVSYSPEVQDIIHRVRYDFCRTRIELFTERFARTFQAWCAENNVKSRMQAYGRGYHPVEASMSVDIPECETWLGTENCSLINKFVASGARFAGKRLVSCEEITNTQTVFNSTLEQIKIVGDYSNLSGVTHSILHGFNYSPPEAEFPGWVRYGTFFSERNSWWPYFRKWADYKARLSWVLQNAEPQADIAILHPLADIWSRWNLQRDPLPTVHYPSYQFNLWEAVHQNGSNCDYISDSIIQKAAVGNGHMEYNSRSYGTLILMELTSIEPDTAAALLRFADAGGKLIFIKHAPSRSPGRVDAAKNDVLVQKTMADILDNHPDTCRVVPAPADNLLAWFADIQRSFELVPDVRFEVPCRDISQISLRTDFRDIFFIANSSADTSYDIRAQFNVTGKTPWLWNPETGERCMVPCDETGSSVNLALYPAGSALLVFEPGRSEPVAVQKSVPAQVVQTIEGPWQAALLHIDGTQRRIRFDRLVDFKNDEQLSSFAGTVVYTTAFETSAAKPSAWLDLGEVHGVSSVKLNGTELGIRWYGRHLYELKDRIKPGSNTLEVSLVTTLGNYCKSLTDNIVAQRWTKHQLIQSSGLLGPVRLLYAAAEQHDSKAQSAEADMQETTEERDKRMEWWREARFGMFVHWGLYSGLAGTWDGKAVGTKGGMEWIQNYVGADTQTYAKRAIPLFKPSSDFARRWARLAKEAGCRYLVFTAKHHEGFALHDSKVSDFDAATVLGRDLAKEIMEAARAEGLGVGFYYSVIDWHHEQYDYTLSKQLPHPLRNKTPERRREHSNYVDFLHAQVDELVSNYGPINILWWDYSAQDFQGQDAWRAFDLMRAVRVKQPHIVMNNRLFRIPEAGWVDMDVTGFTMQLEPKYGDFITPEQHIPATGMPGLDWETCMTMNTTWGYSEHDHQWKSAETLIRNLVDAASKGGNYLLNIGPKGDGSIPTESIERMQAIGEWMKANSESIYGTAASPFESLEWGRCTQKSAGKNTILYLHVFDRPADGRVIVPGLKNAVHGATLLQTQQMLTVARDGKAVVVEVPARVIDAADTVIKLEVSGEGIVLEE